MVGDGYAMSVAARIVHHVFGTTEGTLQIDHPIPSMEGPRPGGEDLGLRQKLQVSMEVQLAILKSLFERVDELAAKGFTQQFLGKEVVVAGTNPPGGIGREAAGRKDTVHMGMSAAPNYFNFAYSALAAISMGMSGSASFQSVRKSWYAARALTVSPCKA